MLCSNASPVSSGAGRNSGFAPYGADLEVFLEKRIFSNTVIRLTGSNLLDSSRDEVFDKFDDQAARTPGL
ncbi:hypothetical protein [Brevundimonas sp.]|uniref:hypothetical protein n=1 Tax=Brevundimonas sp. TaxID=1871086 RepID=UPI003F6F1D33